MHGLGYPSMHVAAGDFSVPCPGDYNAFADMTMSDTPEVARKRKRVKTGCLTCRARKVKCDEVKPLCSNCGGLGIECEWGEGSSTLQSSKTPRQSGDATHNVSSSGKPVTRSPACLACRNARSKCSHSRPSCSRCIAYGHECKYPEPKAKRSLTPSAQSWMNKFCGKDQASAKVFQENENSQCDSIPRDQSQSYYSSLSARNSDEIVGIPQPLAATRETAAVSHEEGSGPSNQSYAHFAQEELSVHSVLESPKFSQQLEREDSPTREAAQSKFLPTQEQIETLAVAFFRHVHIYRANAFLHRERTLLAIREGNMPEGIVFALCAVGARFSTPCESDETVKSWAMHASNCVMTSSEISRDNITTALLLTIYMQQRGCYAQSHLWTSVAMNQAVSLELHREDTKGSHSFVECERDRRLFFACYAMNRFISNGTPETMQCPASRIKLRLPCDGFNWRMDVDVETPYAALETDESHLPAWMYKKVGTMGFWVRLVGARIMIKQFFQSIMENQPIELPPGARSKSPRDTPMMYSVATPWDFNSPFEICMAKLASLRESLPLRLKLSEELLKKRPASGTLDQIVMFYLWWNECYIELCSVVLPGYPQSLGAEILANAPDGWIDQVRQNCLRHATAITDIFVLLEKELRTPLTIYDHTIAHAVYLSIRVQLELVEIDVDNLASRSRIAERFETMLKSVERTSSYFRPVRLVLKELRRMLIRYRISTKEALETESRSETPPLPWFRRQKNLDLERSAAQAANDAASLEAVLLELLPHSNSYGAHPWIRTDDIDLASYTQGSEWESVSAPWISGDSHRSSDISGLTTGDLNDLGILDPWGRVRRGADLPQIDPLLP